MKIEIEVDEQVAKDALVNAIEMGMGMWIQGIDIKKWKCYTTPKIIDPVSFEEQWWYSSIVVLANHSTKKWTFYRASPKKMLECLGAFTKKYPDLGSMYLGAEYEGDALSDDAWLQFTLFGDIVYD